MKISGAENVLRYYGAIPGMIRLLEQERRELEAEYNGLHATAVDAAPHSSAPGKPTEELAVRLAEKGVYRRLRAIDVKVQVLEQDAATIKALLDDMDGKYKRLLSMRGLSGYSWARISVRMGVPDSTARYWYRAALAQLAELLEDTPMGDELEGRASRARSI